MTIIIDDAGSGDLLFGVVIGAYREETEEFKYDVIDVKYFQSRLFKRKEYLKEATRIVLSLLSKLGLKDDERILICRGYIFEDAVKELKSRFGESRVQTIKVVGKPQEYVELAYLDELRNLGYEPIMDRDEKRAKSFFHMLKWIEGNPDRIKYAKNGWPKLRKYRLFRKYMSSTRY